MKLTLRPYQEKAVADVRRALASGKRSVLLVAPTGAGKSLITANVAESAISKGNSVLILAHRQELLSQIADKLSRAGVDYGMVSPQFKPDYSKRVQVASVQTLVRRLDAIEHPTLIVVDEAHHACGGNSWGQVLSANPNAWVLGVTATPERLDGKGLGRDCGGFFDCMVQGPSIWDLQAQGFLSHADHYAAAKRLDLSKLHTRAGDYVNAELADAMDKPSITGDAVAHYARLCPGEPAIAFCVSVAHAENVAAEFRRAGFVARSIDGSMDDSTRAGLIRDLGERKIQVLTSCNIISEGTDVPVVSGAILLRPTKSLSLYLQQVGRVLRPAEGKSRAVILDHAGNCFTHGFIDDERQWSLQGKAKRAGSGGQAAPAVRTCPACFGAHRPAPRCPYCGHIHETEERELRQEEGDLKLISKAEAEAMRKRQRTEVGRARTLAELQAIAKQRGYSPFWAQKVFESRRSRMIG